MKIKYMKVKFDETYQYKHIDYKPCCDNMEGHSDQFFLSGKYEDVDSDDNYGLEMPKVCLYKEETHYSWGDEFTDEFYFPIKCCPFCGEEYDYEVVGEVDYSDIYEKASSNRSDYFKKHNQTDSISRREKLSKLCRKYDDFTNELYRIGEFRELTMEDVDKLEEE